MFDQSEYMRRYRARRWREWLARENPRLSARQLLVLYEQESVRRAARRASKAAQERLL